VRRLRLSCNRPRKYRLPTGHAGTGSDFGANAGTVEGKSFENLQNQKGNSSAAGVNVCKRFRKLYRNDGKTVLGGDCRKKVRGGG